jgi:SAM-dependent methyltransferase
MDKKVLVVGCNDGRDCRFFLEAAAVHGLDICDDIGQGLTHEKVSYFQESAESMTRPDNYYDLVFSAATMEHIPNIEAAFSEIWRVTKPGGMIYCVAAPLWNSYEGHHQYGLFADYPWIHLRLSKNDLILYLQKYKQLEDLKPLVTLQEQEGLLSIPLKSEDKDSYVKNLAEFMFSDYFNFVPSTKYVEAALSLDVSYIIRNDIWQDGEQYLTDDILVELNRKGYNKDEVLSVAHTYIAVK